MNLAKLLEGPALITHRGQAFHSRGGAVLTPTAENFPIDSDAYGQLDQRALDNSIQLALTPVGVFTDPVLDVLYRWRNPIIGGLVTPRYDVASIDTTEDEITLVGTLGPRKGCPIEFDNLDGALPAAITAGTTYFAGVPDADVPNVITLHASEAAAIAGTGKIDIATAGTGDHVLIEQEPLIIHTYQNRRITFHNAALITMPPLNFSARETIFGSVVFEAFRRNDRAWSAANSLFTVDKAVLVDSVPDKTQIPTQEYTLGWGAAPWNAFQTRGPLTMTPELTTTEIETDQRGTLGRKISNLTVSASGVPSGISEAELLAVLNMQGGSVARGVSRTRADLTVAGVGVYATLKNAAARVLPQNFSQTDPRAGALEWVGSRVPGEAAFDISTTLES
jgi:hypothetical protein